MSGSSILAGSDLEKCRNFRKNGRFSGQIWTDWGNAAWADMAGLGSIGLCMEHDAVGLRQLSWMAEWVICVEYIDGKNMIM